MKIKELEQILGITRANIRFYEEKGLLSPKRENNNYREYTQEDLKRLQWVVLLRKMDISIGDIQKLLRNEIQFDAVLRKKEMGLKSKVQELQGAIVLCETMENKGITVQGTDPEQYLQLVQKEEEAGKKFKDILGDISKDYKKDILQGRFGDKNGIRLMINVLLINLLITCFIYFVLRENWQWSIFVPPSTIAVTSVVYFVLKLVATKVKVVEEILQNAEKRKIVLGILNFVTYLFVYMLRPLLPF